MSKEWLEVNERRVAKLPGRSQKVKVAGRFLVISSQESTKALLPGLSARFFAPFLHLPLAASQARVAGLFVSTSALKSARIPCFGEHASGWQGVWVEWLREPRSARACCHRRPLFRHCRPGHGYWFRKE